MKALLGLFTCIFLQGARLLIAGDNDVHSNTPDANANLNDVDSMNGGGGGIIHPSSNDSATPSSFNSSSSTAHDDGNGGNSSNDSELNNGSHVHSSYHYTSNGDRVGTTKYDNDEQTYLDLFGERAKELLTQHIIPSTDAECRWDWRMGRCEPYCTCAFQFLWGDFHLGRSCRLRLGPPPSQFSGEDAARGVNGNEGDESKGTPGWHEAWQEVWQSQLNEGGTVEDVLVSNFVPPLFPKSQAEESGRGKDAPPMSWHRTTASASASSCSLPPESRYIQTIRKLSRASAHSTIMLDQFEKLKSTTSSVMNATVVHGRRHWTNARRQACETVKRKVEERARIRDQPVVLTRQGAAWIRRVCGTNAGGDGGITKGEGGDQRMDDQSDEADDDVDRADNEPDKGTA